MATKTLDQQIAIARANCQKAYDRCAYWEKFLDCAYYRKRIANAQGWLTRRRNQLNALLEQKNNLPDTK